MSAIALPRHEKGILSILCENAVAFDNLRILNRIVVLLYNHIVVGFIILQYVE